MFHAPSPASRLAPPLVLLLLSAGGAAAQDRADPVTTARTRIGPLGLTPDVRVTDSGIDTNIFNEAQDPQRDFTFTVSPQLRTWLRLPAGRLSVQSQVDLVYFRQHARERSADQDTRLAFDLPVHRVRFRSTAAHLSTRRRPNSEIDARSRRTESHVTIGLDARVSGVTTVALEARRSQIAFDRDETFDGENLTRSLNRDENRLTASLRYAVTPVTTVVVSGRHDRIRFRAEPSRDSDNLQLLSGVELGSLDVLEGHAYVGYRRLDGLQAQLPDYAGVVASGDLTYAIGQATHLSVQVARDVTYSYRRAIPYYVSTGWDSAWRQHLAGGWGVELRGGREVIDYSPAAPLDAPTSAPDTVRRLGVGVSYLWRSNTRIDIAVDRRRRDSPIARRNYEGLRTGLSASYEF